MFPLVDLHCHLLAGLDDGPRCDADALAMCRLAYEEGTRLAAATAHQNDYWPSVTPDRIRQATRRLAEQLRAANIPLTVFPCAEVMVHESLEEAWRRGELMSVGDRGHYLLVELPHGLFLDLTEMVKGLRALGVRPILAHPERQEEFLADPERLDDLVRAGCLVQVSSGSLSDPPSRSAEQTLKDWLRRGVVHCLGSDGHSPGRRPPRMAAAHRRIREWAGNEVADRVCGTHGMAILQGLPLRVPPPERRRLGWLPRVW